MKEKKEKKYVKTFVYFCSNEIFEVSVVVFFRSLVIYSLYNCCGCGGIPLYAFQ